MHPYTLALLSNCVTLNAEELAPIRISGEPPVPIGDGPGCPFAPRCFRARPECFASAPPLREVAPGHFAACHTPMPYDAYLRSE